MHPEANGTALDFYYKMPNESFSTFPKIVMNIDNSRMEMRSYGPYSADALQKPIRLVDRSAAIKLADWSVTKVMPAYMPFMFPGPGNPAANRNSNWPVLVVSLYSVETDETRGAPTLNVVGIDGRPLWMTNLPKWSNPEGLRRYLGLKVSTDTSTGITKIMEVVPGSPADKAGLKHGDLISGIIPNQSGMPPMPGMPPGMAGPGMPPMPPGPGMPPMPDEMEMHFPGTSLQDKVCVSVMSSAQGARNVEVTLAQDSPTSYNEKEKAILAALKPKLGGKKVRLRHYTYASYENVALDFRPESIWINTMEKVPPTQSYKFRFKDVPIPDGFWK